MRTYEGYVKVPFARYTYTDASRLKMILLTWLGVAVNVAALLVAAWGVVWAVNSMVAAGRAQFVPVAALVFITVYLFSFTGDD
jgi:hypothetical protein